MQDFYCNIGDRRLVISPSKITIKKMKELQEKMAEIRQKYSPYKAVPRLEKEKAEDWYARYIEHLGEQAKRKDGESNEAFMERTFKPQSALDNLEMLFDTLKMLAESFDNQSDKVTKEAFEDAVYEELCTLVRNVLKRAKISTAEFEIEE